MAVSSQCQQTTTAANPKARDVELAKLLDASFVQSAADRGIDKR